MPELPLIPSIRQLKYTFHIPDNVLIVSAKTFGASRPLTGKPESFNNIDSTDFSDLGLGYASPLGTIVYTNIEFPPLPNPYKDLRTGEEKNYGSLTDGFNKLRYEAVLIFVSQAKKIIKTEIQGRDGTVKEYIGMDDFQVTINGIISGKNRQHPSEEVAALKKMLNAPVAVPVTCGYLENLGIYSLVIDNYEIGQQEGGYSYQTFTIHALSEDPQELQIF